MNRWIGVSTPRSRPMRTTAPLSQGSSSGLPRSRSSSIDDFDPGGRSFMILVNSAAAPAGTATPLARATAMVW